MDLHKWHLADIGRRLTAGFFTSLFDAGVAKARESGDPKYSHLHFDAAKLAGANQANFFNMADRLTQTVWQADTLFVTQDMEEIILQAAHDLPNEAVCYDEHLLLCKTGFMLLDHPIIGMDAHGIETHVGAIAWAFDPMLNVQTVDHDGKVTASDSREMVHIYFYEPPGAPYSEEYAGLLRSGGVPVPPLQFAHYYPLGKAEQMIERIMDFDHSLPGVGLVQDCLRLFVATQLVAQQRIGTVDRTRPPRSTRKRAERWDEEGPDRYISLIQLRKKKAVNNEEPKNVDWTHRWIVGGHWRRQWYPSTKTHEWVYIYEHVKGPEHLPLVVRERRVFNFAR